MFGFGSATLKIISTLVIGAVLFASGYWKGYMREKEKFDAYEIEVIAAGNAQEERTNQAIIEQQQITKKAEERYAKDISTLRVVYDRLRKSSSSSAMPAVPNAPDGSIGATTYYVSIAPDLAIRCGETTQQLVSLQEWVSDQIKVSR